MSDGKEARLEMESGVISGLKVQYVMEDIFWREGDRVGMAATGALSAALGLSGSAAGLAMMSAEEMEEPVAKVEFMLGEVNVEALLWNWPFEEGAFVRVVGTRDSNRGFFALSVLDESMKLIVSYPHVSAGTWAHWVSVAKYSVVFAATYWAVFLGLLSVTTSLPNQVLIYAYLGGIIVSGAVGYRVGRRFSRFARMADSIFDTLGWKRGASINLRRTTKAKRQDGDHPALGDTYFRY
ncbi:MULTISPECIES: putative type VI secretion system effector [Stenotrophomonas]|uniref:putative type VI secretion system effector n=1 Tax=Stenotrophomonas TaxID=40323 RepID=UPI002899D132|nr:putative type VI secretion system effector [Stenotrophomonas sp.]